MDSSTLNAVRPEIACKIGIANVDDDAWDGEEGGVRVPKKALDPRLPSAEEIAEHELTHLPFRSWFVHCVRGRGEAHPHWRAERDEGAVPEIHKYGLLFPRKAC